ncbi:hypothetical protein BVG19_g2283 [[Candida] boidinii]|nr:hypothetical protein BVG19_g2283 [[Candida] boidinii]OWB52087.1 hypothetical protein B5S27_g3659 [[Candida] boidinii]
MTNPNDLKIPSSHTLWSPADTVKDAAESLGILSLTEDVSKNLAMDVEYRIHEILEQALKFMRHGKRKTLTVQEINRAMKILNLEPLYGYDVSKPLIFKEAVVGAGQTLYYIDDDDIDLEKLVNQPLPKVPRFTSFTAHWLAIEGIQPTIPQNPLPREIKELPASQRGSMSNMLSLNNDDLSITSLPNSNVTVIENKNKEENNNLLNGTNNANGNLSINMSSKNSNLKNKLNSSSATTTTANNSNNDSKKNLDVKPLVKHMLSKELQIYFDKAIQALLDENNDYLKNATLESIKSDPGLHQLVPYFIQFIAESITHNLKNINILTTMLMMIYSLLCNTSIFLDPYIHALMPCILTLLLAKKIGPTPNNNNNTTTSRVTASEPVAQAAIGDNSDVKAEVVAPAAPSATLTSETSANSNSSTEEDESKQHFKLRELSASLLDRILKNYGSSYTTLKPRIARTLSKAFLRDTTKLSIGTQFGALKGIKCLGPEVIRLLVVDNLKYWSNSVLSNFDKDDENYKILLDNIMDLLLVLAKDSKILLKSKRRREDDDESEENAEDDAMDIDSKDSNQLTDEMIKKLNNRIGETITKEIQKQKNPKLIYYGIYFGEISK